MKVFAKMTIFLWVYYPSEQFTEEVIWWERDGWWHSKAAKQRLEKYDEVYLALVSLRQVLFY